MVASNLYSPALPYRLLPGGASARRKQITLPQTSLLIRERYKPRVSTMHTGISGNAGKGHS